MSNQLALKAVEIAKSKIGQDEKPHGSNWGEPVRTFLINVGLNFPASWCMAFVYTCFKEAAQVLNLVNTAFKSAGCLDVWARVNPAYKSGTPSVGAAVIFDHGHGLGHTGIVYKFDDLTIYTVEGNTNNNGSREGFDIEYKDHLRTNPTIKGYINYPDKALV